MKSNYLYYFYSYSFADQIAREIVGKIIGTNNFTSVNGYEKKYNSDQKKTKFNRRIWHLKRFLRPGVDGGHESPGLPPIEQPKRLLTLGSILAGVKDGDVIWGSGINTKWQNLEAPCAEPDIRAVRGPLTRQFMQRRYGWECPEVYGDPAILIPELFPEFKLDQEKEYTVIFQHNDEEYVRSIPEFNRFNIFYCQKLEQKTWREVMENILSSHFVISSSLHAIIIAEMYGIPARWLRGPDLPSSETESAFKFNDYYMSTGREPYQFSLTIDKAFVDGGASPPIGLSKQLLLDSFPRELFNES